MGLGLLAVVGSLSVTVPRAAQAAVPSGFRDYVVFRGLTMPTTMEFAADGRVFVAEKSGIIRVFDNVDDPTATVFADLRTQVHDFWDRGLLGLALHPDFPASPYVYALYTYDAAIGGTAPRWGDGCPTPPGPNEDGCEVSGRLSRLEASGDRAAGEAVLIEDWCAQFPSHTIGDLEFGPDGMLYASAGDGASFKGTDYGHKGNPVNPCGDPPGGPGTGLSPPTAEGGALRSQDLRTPGDPTGLDGTIIRVDPMTGAAAVGNPLAGSGDANARRIVASGLRNPFRFTFRPGTTELYVGDVGFGAWEEINRIASPTDARVENLGWPCYEGNGRQTAYDGLDLNVCESLYGSAGAVTSPFFTWSHSAEVVRGDGCGSGNSSVSGLTFYESGSYPDSFDGALLFADYSRRCIWSMRRNASGALDPATRATLVTGAQGPVDLERGPEGDLYYIALNDGTIHRIGYSAGNQTPFAVATASPTSGGVPLTVAFDGSGSSDPDAGDSLSYAWDLDADGAFDDSTAVAPSFTYGAAGPVTVRLRVTDALGARDEASVTIAVDITAPVPTIESPAGDVSGTVGQVVTFSGSANDPQEGVLPASALTWSVVLHHCSAPDQCHTHPLSTFEGVASGSFVIPDHERIAFLDLTLSATSGGETRSATRRIDYRTSTLTFRSSPSTIRLTVGAESLPAPFVRTEHTSGLVSVSAPATASVNGVSYAFESWSDGGARSHDLTAPAAPTTYTAVYRPVASVPTTVIVDNTSSGVVRTGSWTVSRSTPGYYGVDYLHNGNTGRGTKAVRFTPVLPQPGRYEVFARWPATSNRASNVGIVIEHDGGSTTRTVDQRAQGGIWVSLGSYGFDAVRDGSVEVTTAGTNGYVIADAVRFVHRP